MPESPFRPYNPMLAPSRSTRGNQVAVPQYGVIGTTFSTTTTGSALYLFSGTIVTKGRTRSALLYSANTALVHSAPTASVDVAVFMDYGVGTGLGSYLSYYPSVPITSATLYTPVFMGRSVDLDAVGMSPGQHTIGVVVVLNTAGTLTMRDSSSGYNTLVNTLTTMEVGFTQP